MPLLCVNLDGKYNLRYNIATQHKVLQITTLLQAKEERQSSTNLSIVLRDRLMVAQSTDACANKRSINRAARSIDTVTRAFPF